MTTLESLRPYLRHLLGDRDAAVYQYSDANLDAGVRTVVAMGLVSGYAVSGDGQSVTPTLSDPNALALLLYETVRSFVVSQPDSFSFKTRGFSQSQGAWKVFLSELDQRVHEMRNGTMFDGWQTFHGWYAGMVGLDAGALWTRLNLNAPQESVTVPEG